MSHHSSYSQITVVVCSPTEFVSRLVVVAGLVVRSHHSPNLQNSPIPLVTVNALSAPIWTPISFVWRHQPLTLLMCVFLITMSRHGLIIG